MELLREGTALLVVDMQNGFLRDDGSIPRIGLDITMCKQAVAPCATLIASARRAGVPVIYTRYVYRADYADGGILARHLLPQMMEVGALKAGTWDVEVVEELAPAEGEVVIDKNRPSAFYGTPLESILNGFDVERLVVCGVTTNCCVETTVRDASQRDYQTFVVSDATGELDPRRHDHALEAMGMLFGDVVTVADVQRAWNAGG